MAILQCTQCSTTQEQYPPKYRCEKCGGLLQYTYDFSKSSKMKLAGPFNFWRYKPFLPKVKSTVSMGEGGTPLHKAERLAKEFSVKAVYLKDETRNPTNSFRDRCAALMISNALDLKQRSVVCASSGNLGASLAAYCAKSELACHIVVPKMVDMGKLAQMLIYDADIEEFGEVVDESIKRAESLGEETKWYQATAELNPLVIEAQKTIAYEVFEQIGVPTWFIVSMGSGGTIHSVWKGFKELQSLGKINALPRMIGVQAEGCAPISKAYSKGEQKPSTVLKPFTHALSILVSNPLNGAWALETIRESNGVAVSVTDSEIIVAEQQIARMEGIFAEPSGAAAVSALQKLVKQGTIEPKDTVVCLITGSGLKATDVLQALTKKRKTAVVGLELSTKEKVLRILSQKDAYGYELWKKLGKTMTRPAVYQHLNDLLKKGMVVAYENEERKYFKTTKRGKRILKAIDELKTLL